MVVVYSVVSKCICNNNRQIKTEENQRCIVAAGHVNDCPKNDVITANLTHRRDYGVASFLNRQSTQARILGLDNSYK